MRVRIIFRGLTLFQLDPPAANAKPNEFGKLTAWLVSDPEHAAMPPHTHTPYMGMIGRDAKAPYSYRTETKRRIWKDLKIELMGHPPCNCVTAHQSFLDYVPDLDALGWGRRGDARTDLITRKIIIPHGTIRARDFIEWDWYGKSPARIAYMKTSIVGYATNEVVVDLGDDDTDANNNDPEKYLALTSPDGTEEYERLWPRIKAGQWDDDIDPNTVELVFTNLPPRRRRAVFWGMHFQSLLKAAGYAENDYSKETEFLDFAKLAGDYDSDEWKEDQALGATYPFPYLIVRDGEQPPGLAPNSDERTRIPVVPPAPPGRGKKGAVPGVKTGSPTPAGTGPHDHPGDDPENREICPFARVMLSPV